MPKNKIINENFREQMAKELGVYDTVKIEGWGGAAKKDFGSVIMRAPHNNQSNIR